MGGGDTGVTEELVVFAEEPMVANEPGVVAEQLRVANELAVVELWRSRGLLRRSRCC